MKKDIHHIHDKSYKALFSNKDIFLNLIHDFTHEKWKEKLTSEHLTLINKSFILSDYEELESDIVYQAEIEGQKVFFYILLEFQSSIDHSMPIRLLMYMIEIWREYFKGISKDELKRKDFKLPAIVPIVTYNGKDIWNVPRSLKEKIAKYELFGEKLLDFEYILLDVNRLDKNVLLEKGSISSAIFLLDQKVSYQEYMTRLITIVTAFNKLTLKDKLEIKNWLSHTLIDEVKEVALEILDADKEDINKMTANITITLQELKEEAKKQGLLEGRLEGRLEGEQKGKLEEKIAIAISLMDILDDQTISEKTKLPIEQVKSLRNKNTH